MPRILSEYNRHAVEALSRIAGLAAEVQSVLDGMTDRLLERCRTGDDGRSWELDCREFDDVPPLLRRELFITIWKLRRWPLKDMGFRQWDELGMLADPLDERRASRAFPGGVVARREGNILRIESLCQTDV
jgi:hypothetical protein